MAVGLARYDDAPSSEERDCGQLFLRPVRLCADVHLWGHDKSIYGPALLVGALRSRLSDVSVRAHVDSSVRPAGQWRNGPPDVTLTVWSGLTSLTLLHSPIAPKSSWNLRTLTAQTALGIALYCLIAVPFVSAISKSKGRFTIGDSARLNWAWNINHLPRHHWQGEDPQFGAPLHPTRKLFAAPDIYVFDGPFSATYADWYDPSYWYDGYRPVFDAGSVLREIEINGLLYWKIFFGIQIGAVAAWIFLSLNGGQGGGSLSSLEENWLVFLPAAAALCMYAVVYAEKRYVAPFFVLLWMGLFYAIRVPARFADRRATRLAVALGSIFILLPSVGPVLHQSGRKDFFNGEKAPRQVEIAEGLHRMGIEAGDKVAWIRPQIFDSDHNYEWARLARVRIIAEIPGSDEEAFWTARPSVQAAALRAFQSTSAKALIVTQLPKGAPLLNWLPVGATGYYLRFLSGRQQ